MDENPESAGGQGGFARFSRSDLALMRRAARERWGVPDECQTETIWQASKILADPESSARAKLAAGKLLADLSRIDQRDDALDLLKAKDARESGQSSDGMADVHRRMAEYRDDDGGRPGEDAGLVPPAEQPA